MRAPGPVLRFETPSLRRFRAGIGVMASAAAVAGEFS